jgi:hypothetical protein
VRTVEELEAENVELKTRLAKVLIMLRDCIDTAVGKPHAPETPTAPTQEGTEGVLPALVEKFSGGVGERDLRLHCGTSRRETTQTLAYLHRMGFIGVGGGKVWPTTEGAKHYRAEKKTD